MSLWGPGDVRAAHTTPRGEGGQQVRREDQLETSLAISACRYAGRLQERPRGRPVLSPSVSPESIGRWPRYMTQPRESLGIRRNRTWRAFSVSPHRGSRHSVLFTDQSIKHPDDTEPGSLSSRGVRAHNQYRHRTLPPRVVHVCF